MSGPQSHPGPAPTAVRADDMLFRPVRSANAFEETVERLLQVARLGILAPGSRLPPEREVAARLGVSRAKLRQAIAALVDAGYLESRRGRHGGTFVRAPDPTPGGRETGDRPLRRFADRHEPELADTLALRRVLEAGAADLAATVVLGPSEHDHLRSCLQASTGASVAGYRRADSRLHLAVAEVTGSASLTAAVADIRMRVEELLDGIPLLTPNLEHSNRQHAGVVAAVLDGDPLRARTLMGEHLEGTAMLLRGFLQP